MIRAWRDWRLARAAARAAPGSSLFVESTLAQLAWQRKRMAVARWGFAGALCGALLGVLAFAPATWLARAVASGSGERLLLADARGTVWNGSAVPVLTGGPDSRSAAALPGRLSWSLGLRGLALELRLHQPCCMDRELVLLLRPGLGGTQVQLPGGAGSLGEWPAAWLAGLGAPWNTLKLGGSLRLSSPGMSLDTGAAPPRLQGQAEIELSNVSSSLSTLERLGSYRVRIEGGAAGGVGIVLNTLDGALILNGSGSWNDSRFRFKGEARAAPGFESALDNLLNILGRRQGALSILSIG